MARYAVAYNTTDSPVVIDDDGRVAAGHEWTPVLRSHDLVRQAVERGALVIMAGDADQADDLDPQARDAFAARNDLNAATDPAELAAVADDAGATPTKAARKAAAKEEK